MSQPVPFVPSYSYLTTQASFSWFPGQDLDVDFANVKETTDEIRFNLALIQRDDGGLKNGIVTTESLDATLLAQLGPQSLVEAQAAAAAAAASASASSVSAGLSQTYSNNSATSATNSATSATSSAASAAASAASAAEAASLVGLSVGGVLGGTLPNPTMASGAAATNVGTLGGVLGGTLPNPTMAAGAASTNVGSVGGDLTGTLPNPTVGTNKVTNAKSAQMAAVTLKGNPTNATANATDFTIASLTALATPDATNDYTLIWDHTAGTIKKITAAALATAATAGVTTFATRNGDVVPAANDYGVTDLKATTANRLFGTSGAGAAGVIALGTGLALASSSLAVSAAPSSVVNYTATGTGGASQTLTARLDRQLYITDFGASTGASGATNLAALQNAEAAAAALGAELIIPIGTFNVSGAWTLTHDLHLRGVSRTGSILAFASGNNGIVAGANVVHLSNFAITAPTATAVWLGSSTVDNYYSIVEKLFIQTCDTGIRCYNCIRARIIYNDIYDFTGSGAYVWSPRDQDRGDCFFESNYINPATHTAAYCVQHVSGGGWTYHANHLLGGAIGLFVNFPGAVSVLTNSTVSSSYTITSNQIAGQPINIYFANQNTSGGFIFDVTIASNALGCNANGAAVQIDAPGGRVWLYPLVISGNTIANLNATNSTSLNIDGVQVFTITGNSLLDQGSGTLNGVFVGSHCSTGYVSLNLVANHTNPYNNAGAPAVNFINNGSGINQVP